MYQLVFQGECTPGTDEQSARANARALFKASVDQVERMFSGKRVVIRNKLEQEQAEKYVAVLRKHGMVAYAEPMTPPAGETGPAPRPATPASTPPPAATRPEPEAKPEPEPQPAQAPSAAATGDGVKVEPGDRPNVAGEKVDSILAGSSLQVAPAHDRLSEERRVEAPLFEHLDDWTIAPAGTTLVEEREEVPPAVPDISHLSLADDRKDRQ
ncbi:hypothetical protein EZI54_05055 [Marinobacter halodurans]|uniref:Uncharacterized protein n=1 Tax=Marinobacter halodurans TaxID=2528979 RepID=A0ABY1ZSS6_9GAMM|nr:hypothetical protein [Marinobacter halodurans]TBW58219.1 hypothetical protein EZI54_05055 [Marinobacter halodurans]